MTCKLMYKTFNNFVMLVILAFVKYRKGKFYIKQESLNSSIVYDISLKNGRIKISDIQSRIFCLD